MSKEKKQIEQGLDIAFERIAAEKSARTGRLDLGNLGLTLLPTTLFDLDWLEELRLGGVLNEGGIVFRQSGDDSWEEIDEIYNPNRIEDIAPSLTNLLRLRILDCSGADLQDLTPLAGLTALHSLDCGGTWVVDLTPLAGLNALHSLNCGDTQVADLTPLAGLNALHSLDCGDTQVADLTPLAGLTALHSLDCGGTGVVDLTPLAGLNALHSLNCGDTQVADLTPLAGLTALHSLDCGGTGVVDLTPLAGLAALHSLDCGYTQVADLTPLVGLTALHSLNCERTQVADLTPLAGLTVLHSLDCERTQVTDLTPLAGLTALHSLGCGGTQVVDLTPLAGLTALHSLGCGGTQVVDLTPLAGLAALHSLDCGYTWVVDLTPLAGLAALHSLDCGNNEVADLTSLAGLAALQSLDCGDTQVADLTPLAGLNALHSLDCGDTQVADLTPLAGLNALHSLDCGDTQVADLTPLAGLTALHSLDCGGTWVVDLTPLAGLNALHSLDCGDTQVADLTPLAGLTALHSLDCRSTQVAGLTPLAGLAALHSLDCGDTQVADLTPLAGLAALQSLNCERTQVADLTPLAGLTVLHSLDCGDTGVVDLTPLAGLAALHSLNCLDTQVADLTPLVGLTVLHSLDCERTQVTDLTPLAGLTALHSLDCGYTQVADLTPLAGLTALHSLDCGYTQVADLTPLAGLAALHSLNCLDTQVADLTPLAGLTALQSLNCRDTQVADLTPLTGLTALQSLDCGRTQVVDLTPLAGLTALDSLDCRNTQVADLTPLAGLTALHALYLHSASISVLPETVIGLPQLERLVINARLTLSDIPAEVLSQDYLDNCLPRLRAHLTDLDAGAKPLRDMKVIVLGNGRIGKTQICRRLRGELFEVDADSTHGISVTLVELAMPAGEEPSLLNLWDFGGQDIYHGTHALFMRTRAVFLLVWTPDSEQGDHEHGGMVFRNQPLPYWLEYIRHLGGGQSPVILVQNQCDGGRGESPNLPVDEALLRPLLDDDRLFTRVVYSAKDDTGRTRLMDALQQAVIRLREVQGRPRIGRNRLVVWNQLRAWRDADAHDTDEMHRRHRLLPYRDFEALCQEYEVHSPETFAEVLHHAGMVFYRPNLFDNQLVLDQSWALNAIYAVFTREGAVYGTLKRFGGHFTQSALDALLWGARGLSGKDQQSLLGMMEASGICFVHQYAGANDETEYVAPELLPEGSEPLSDALAARWEPLSGEPLVAAFTYPFLSPAISRAVMSNLGGLAGSTALYWRYGLCLYDAASCATAIVDEVSNTEGYGGRVRIQVKGKGRSAEILQRKLIERISKLNEHSGWSGRLMEAEMPRHIDSDPPEIEPATPPAIEPAEPEVYVSYAWAQERQDPLVDALCAALDEQGLRVRRDSTELQPGDRISHYMERLSAGRCVVLVLSKAYLRSEFCMMELYRLYTNACQRDDEFLHRIVPLVQDDARIDAIDDRIDHAVYWKTRYKNLDDQIKEHGTDVIGAEDFRRFKLIGEFYRHVGDMLAYSNDVLVPRDRPTLSRDGFAMVRDLIDRASA